MNAPESNFHTPTVLSIFSVFSCPEINRNQTSVKKLEFFSFSPIGRAYANNYMLVTSIDVFLLFTHHLYSIQLVKHCSLILPLFHDSVFLVK